MFNTSPSAATGAYTSALAASIYHSHFLPPHAVWLYRDAAALVMPFANSKTLLDLVNTMIMQKNGGSLSGSGSGNGSGREASPAGEGIWGAGRGAAGGGGGAPGAVGEASRGIHAGPREWEHPGGSGCGDADPEECVGCGCGEQSIARYVFVSVYVCVCYSMNQCMYNHTFIYIYK